MDPVARDAALYPHDRVRLTGRVSVATLTGKPGVPAEVFEDGRLGVVIYSQSDTSLYVEVLFDGSRQPAQVLRSQLNRE